MSTLSPQGIRRLAQVAAALNILSGLPDGFSIFVLRKLYARDDAAETIRRILANESQLRLGCVAEIMGVALFTVSCVLLYELFVPASRRTSRIMLSFLLVGAAIQSLDVLCDFAALYVAKLSSATPAVGPLALVLLRMHSQVFTVALVFIGLGSLSIAVALRQATFLPRILVPLMIIDGLGYVSSSVVTLLSPALAVHISPPLPYVTALGELALFLWLIIKGVDAERWQEQNAAAHRPTES
jgi:hypothetical protein